MTIVTVDLVDQKKNENRAGKRPVGLDFSFSIEDEVLMPLHDFGRASLPASRGTIRLGRSLALPESREAIEMEQ